jgi:putative restriction endonuclease
MSENDTLVRAAAFDHLRRIVHPGRRTVTWSAMLQGVDFQGRRVPLAGPRGIHRPAGMTFPLSITSSPAPRNRAHRYDDGLTEEGFLSYKYQGTDPDQWDNRAMRACLQSGTPLIYFFGLEPGLYEARWPVRVIADEPERLQVLVAIDEGLAMSSDGSMIADPVRAQRAYATRIISQRLHQSGFRVRVLNAYRKRCTICTLRHEELLDAAHIIPDTDERGVPEVRNGLAMCKIHHAAFDVHVLGVDPNHVVQIREDVLREKDGPMLLHGLQEFHGKRIEPPKDPADLPDPDFLAERFKRFRETG